MAIAIKRAVKYDSKLRMALAGPSGSGKTYTALTLATALSGDKGVIVVDTERGSASKYADLFTFDVIDLESFSPLAYIEAIKAAEEAGYGVLVIDSLSHAWNGSGGILEIVENVTKRSNSKNSFNAWGEATPLQNKLIDAITRAKLHVICTMRTKTEYVIEQSSTGKSAPRKVGTAPVQRADVEYEFDIYADLDIDNTLIVHKSRCPQLSSAVIAKPDAKVADILSQWLHGEIQPPQASEKPATPQNNGTPNHTAENGKAMPASSRQGIPAWTAERRAQVTSLYNRSSHVAGVLDTGGFLAYTGRLLEREVTTIKAFTDDELGRIDLDLTSREKQPVGK